MSEQYAFLHRDPTDDELRAIQERMLLRAYKPNKNGEAKLDGDDFAHCLADLWGCRYVNNKKPLDVLCPLGEKTMGVEIKHKEHNPHRTGQLLIELSNGSSAAWKSITRTSKLKKTEMNTSDPAHAVATGEAYLTYLWERLSDYRRELVRGKKFLDLDQSRFAVAQRYDVEGRNTYQIFALPLTAIPDHGELAWSFREGGKCLCGYDMAGKLKIEWYWCDNGICKFHPTIDQCSRVSPCFEVKTALIDLIVRGTKNGLDEFIRYLNERHLSDDLYTVALLVGHQKYPGEFATLFKKLTKGGQGCPENTC